MKELIKICKDNRGTSAVNARDLHTFLVKEAKGGQKGEQFNHWVKRMMKYGFEDGLDYVILEYDYKRNLLNTRLAKNSHPDNQAVRVDKKDYILSIDCAKEISMLQNNDRGRQARKYFIECEKKLKNQLPQSFAEALQLAADQAKKIEQQQAAIKEEKSKNLILESANKDMIPKARFAEAVADSEDTILVRELAKIIKQSGVEIGGQRLWDWLRDREYITKKGTEPTQKAMELDVFRVIERTITNGDGETLVTKTTKVTGKGQEYFINKFLSTRDNGCIKWGEA